MIAIGSPTGLQKGRGGFLRSADDAPYVTDPTGDLVKTGERKGEVKRVKYGSPSKAGTLIENDVGLTKYKQDYIFLGIGMSDEIREMCKALVDMEFGTPEYRKAANTIVVEADKITRSWLAADRGSHGHAITEHMDREEWSTLTGEEFVAKGEVLGLDEMTQRSVVGAWRRLLQDNGLEILAIEAACVDDRWRLAGTLDRIVRTTRPLTFVKPDGELVVIPANTVLILDIKFGQVRRAHLIQIASYAQSVPYDTDTETRDVWPWPISTTHALIAHGDFGDDTRPVTIELVWVDLAAGREHGGQCVVDAKLWSARDDLWSVAQLEVPVDEPTRKEASGEATVPNSTGTPPLAATADDLWSVAQIVEGAHTEAVSTGDPAPSTPVLAATADDLRAATAGEGHADTSPATFTVNDLLPRQGMPQHALDEIEVDRLNEQRRQSYDGWTVTASPVTAKQLKVTTVTAIPVPDRDRLALVDARAQLPTTVDQGLNLSGPEYDEQWAVLQRHYNELDAAAKAWLGGLISQATRRGLSFHARHVKTVRTYELYRALITLCINEADDDEITRALLALVVGDIALFPGLELGHIIGSLEYHEATMFANLLDDYTNARLVAYTDDDGALRYRSGVTA